MKKGLNLSAIATLVILALSCQNSFAAQASTITPTDRVDNANDTDRTNNGLIDSNKVIELKDGTKVREMTNDKQRSLYQIALLSSISIQELRAINSGRYDKKDIVEVGQRLVLPENSPLLPEIVKVDKKNDKYQNLPKLGSDDNYDVKKDNSEGATQVASVLQTLASQDWKELTSSKNGSLSDQVRDKLKDRGQTYAEDYVRSGVKNQIVDPVRSAAQDFLGRFGTAQLQFDVSDEGQFNNVNVKLFSPWYDSDSSLLFSQLTFQEYEHNRRIGNIGIGQRFDVDDKKWLLGYNVFFDHDFQRSHNRLGLGLEAWSDYMKFAANYYHPLSDWKNSRDFDDYLERAAKGFDVRFQGYLPQYPHLGASIMYEQYFGDKVGLFGKDNLQKDPHAVTVGIDYTPVPLFTVKASHKQGEDSKKATIGELTMNYRIGTPLKDQLDPDMVQAARSLKGSRYDLVDRNNYIVLEYKEKKISVDLYIDQFEVDEGTIVPVRVGLHNAKGLKNIKWSGDLDQLDQDIIASTNNIYAASGNQIQVPASKELVGSLCFNRPGGSSQLSGSFTLCAENPKTRSVSANPPLKWKETHGLITDPSDLTDPNKWSVMAPTFFNDNGISNKNIYQFQVTVTDGRGKTASSNLVTFKIRRNAEKYNLGLYPVIVSEVSGVNKGKDTIQDPKDAVYNISSQTPFIIQGNIIEKNEPTTAVGLDADNVQGFNDPVAYKLHPDATSSPKSDDVKKLNGIWTATTTVSGKPETVTFIAPNEKCNATYCLVVNKIIKQEGRIDGLTHYADRYALELSTIQDSAALGTVTFTLNLSNGYENTTYVNFIGGIPLSQYIEIFDEDMNLVSLQQADLTKPEHKDVIDDSIAVYDETKDQSTENKKNRQNIGYNETTSLEIGKKYYAVARFYENGEPLSTDDYEYKWYLTGGNDKACRTDTSKYQPAPVTLKIPVKESSADKNDYAGVTYQTMYIPQNNDKSALNGADYKKYNCAGDQGFRLRVEVTPKTK